MRVAALKAYLDYVGRVLLHAELVELVFEGSEDHLVDFVRPVGEDLGD